MSFSRDETRWESCAHRWIDAGIKESAQKQFKSMTSEEQKILEKLGGVEKMKEIVKG